jgi:hypothetical protein
MSEAERKTPIGQRIIEEAFDLLREHPDGVRFAELVRQVSQAGSFNTNTVNGNVWDLDQRFPEKVYKPARGLFRLVEFRDIETGQLRPDLVPEAPRRVHEEDFYKPFADWLVNDLEECTKAIPLGGSRFKDRWGTPDVIGKRESKKSDILPAETEILSAEIKLDTNQLVTAFGQACAYRLFSHKSYLVVPNASPQDEVARLDSLCQVFDIGLILFDSSSPDAANFEIRVRARKQDPDMFYVNKYLKLIEAELFS